MQNLSVFGSSLLLSVITTSAPEVHTCVFKLWVASSFLEHLRVTRIAVFSSQAEKINVSFRFQATKSTTNKVGEGRHRSQHDEEGLRESDFWIHDKASEDLQSYTMVQSALVLKVKKRTAGAECGRFVCSYYVCFCL